MITEVILYNLNCIDNTYTNTLKFKSLQEQQSFFNSLNSQIVFTKFSYIRKNTQIKVEGLVDNLYKFNYLSYTNGYKTYYCFINNMTYISDTVTLLDVEIDVMMTYQFDYELGYCYVDRMHVDRWTTNGLPTQEVIDEGITTGEYIEIDKETLYTYKDNYIVVSSVPLGNLNSDNNNISDPGNTTPVIPSANCPYNKNLSASERSFITRIYPGAVEGYKTYKVLPAVTIAQAILESGWGRYTPPNSNNLFGIKADSSWKGAKVRTETTEYHSDGSAYKIEAYFRSYPSESASVLDHDKFLYENPRYTKAGVFSATTTRGQIEAIARAGYATSPTYANQLMQIVNDFNLNIYNGE